MRFDYLIVGAGFSGATLAERIASQLDKRVLLLDRRNHIGGDAHDYYDEDGVLVHRYGPHIFHTNDARVWNYLSQFTEWRPYHHRVLGVVEGKKVPVPFNLNSLHALFAREQAARLETELLNQYGLGAKVPILKLRQSSSREVAALAEYVYEKVFRGYTVKQWGLTPEQLSPSVTARVPVVLSRDDRYFQDRYQAMPRLGYSALFQRMLAHPNIKLLLNTDYREVVGEVKFERLIYTGPIDAFFDYAQGRLPYRSLRFQRAHHGRARVQEAAVINYPNEHAFTRIVEFKHMTGQRATGSTTFTEYPQEYVEGENEPYYPVPREENAEIHARYEAEAAKLPSVVFAGRLADYRYYNMDQAVARALLVFEKDIVGVEEYACAAHA